MRSKVHIGQGIRLLALAAFLVAIALFQKPGAAQEGAAQDASAGDRLVLVAAIEGPIGPATTRHVEKVVEEAAERRAEALVLRLNTPGGLADAMREIIAEIIGSPVPVIGYVAPPGAHAASAGTYILYATHVAAMAPATNLGAATPVQIGGMPGLPSGEDGKGERGGEGSVEGSGEESGGEAEPAGAEDGTGQEGGSEPQPAPAPLSGADAMTAKVTNDAVAFIRSLAEMRGRNADWAEKAVREAASLSAAQALERDVIDLVADDLEALLEKADGRTVSVAGAERTISTRGAIVEQIEQDAITRLLGVLSNPNVAFVLMMIGIYGLIFEFTNPGSIGPGVIGAICLTLALYALNQLPLDYAGLALIVLGVAFMVAEAFTPTLGILGLGGLVSFMIGATMLIDTEAPAYQLSWWVIGTMAAMSGAILMLVLGYTWRAYRGAPVSGLEHLKGSEASVLDWAGDEGFVWIQGERWHATGARGLEPGDTVRVRDADGLTLIVDAGADERREAPATRAQGE